MRTSLLVIALLLGGTVLARAGQTSPSLTISWKALPATAEARIEDARTDPPSPSTGRVLALSKPFPVPWSQPESHHPDSVPFSVIQVAAQLRNSQAAPLMFQPVAFVLKTMFGSVDFGARPTDEEGKVELVIRDRRRGTYPIVVSYGGDGSNEPIRSQAMVDFGVRPRPALPTVGVLVGPSFSPEIGLPFLCFYGGMWCVFAYCVGYLAFWRMRQARESGRELSRELGQRVPQD